MSEAMGSGPIEDGYRERMRGIANALDDALNPDGRRAVGFVLMVFAFDGGRMNYISNANRADVMTALREQLRYFEGMPDNTQGTA